ncbi:hypothetical protein PQC07_gp223 [Aeromonas phage D3]|uniref:Uncharacterized protein n=1 Tax=Aeromonas phage D3 TaxID=2593327 RepID=A0A514TVK4_9CAUD|nr:hypothetical protein PQC07_gp223 [Aeromonas phage D3]QDJ97049.1 hypothetical protein D3_0052 [Aeromonas phage D3]QEP52355.1 hypothetical protein D9_0148 [Aeromonas phage D9]
MFEAMSNSQAFGFAFFGAIGVIAVIAIGANEYFKAKKALKRPMATRNKR